MDWSAVAKTVAPFAPAAGRFLGGLVPFPGGAFAGGIIGNLIAQALGVPATPEAVDDAIRTTPPAEVQAKLDPIEGLARIAEAEAADRTAQSQAINETMRAEIAAGVSWWHWRHLIGYCVLVWFIVPIPVFAVLTFRYNPDAVKQLTELIGACIPLYGFMAALLGYVAQDSTKLKTTAITGEQPPSAADTFIQSTKRVFVPSKRSAKVAPSRIVPLNQRD